MVRLSTTIEERDPMSIKREAIDKGTIDFSDMRSGRRLPSVPPGTILRDELLTPMAISVYALADAIKAPRACINDIVLGRARSRSIRRFGLDIILRHRRSSGSICKRATISISPIAPFVARSNRRSRRVPHEK